MLCVCLLEEMFLIHYISIFVYFSSFSIVLVPLSVLEILHLYSILRRLIFRYFLISIFSNAPKMIKNSSINDNKDVLLISKVDFK